MDLYKGKTIADVKAVVEVGQDPNTLIDIEDGLRPFRPDLEYTDTSAIYHLRKVLPLPRKRQLRRRVFPSSREFLFLCRLNNDQEQERKACGSAPVFHAAFLSGSTPPPRFSAGGCRCVEHEGTAALPQGLGSSGETCSPLHSVHCLSAVL